MPQRHFTNDLRSVTPKEVAKKPVVSYFRVSTVGQGESDRSGLDRQEEATHNGWLNRYGDEHVLIQNVTQEGISGAKQGRFDWFLKGGWRTATASAEPSCCVSACLALAG